MQTRKRKHRRDAQEDLLKAKVHAVSVVQGSPAAETAVPLEAAEDAAEQEDPEALCVDRAVLRRPSSALRLLSQLKSAIQRFHLQDLTPYASFQLAALRKWVAT